MANIIQVPPKAGALCESIRGIGYSLSTAISDIVDNSISAGATRIDVYIRKATTKSEATVEIRDDGEGMTRDELVNAMSLGSISPSTKRRKDDLGRFGLGLKTASFSQCRRLTVVSKKNEESSAFMWDIDKLNETNTWDLIESSSSDIKKISSKSGTVVRWSSIDKISWLQADSDKTELLSGIKDLQKNLELTFHRFLKDGDFKLFINDRPLHPWDPFYSDDPGAPKTYPEEPLVINGTIVAKVRQYIIPPAEYRKNTITFGQDDDMELQGFFLYRGKRLISHGGWLSLKGLRRGPEFCLARIKVEFMNDYDMDWKLDIRKSIAKPPRELRNSLFKYAVWTRTASEQIIRSSASSRFTELRARGASMWLKRRNMVPLPDLADPIVTIVREEIAKGTVSIDFIQSWEEILAFAHPTVAEKASTQTRTKQINEAVKLIYRLLEKKLNAEQAKYILMSRSPFKDWDALMMSIFGTDK